jgi:hypothetical protein
LNRFLNKYNLIERKSDVIYKTGPEKYMRGELYFYQNIPSFFIDYFPKMINYNKIDDKIQIQTEFIKGIPLYYLYKNKLVTNEMMDKLFSILEKFHNNKNIPITIQREAVLNNYILKLSQRFKNKNDYPFDDAEIIFKQIIEGKTEIDKSLLDDLYFDLRMNETANIRDKLILGYKIASDFIKNGELHITPKNVISHNPESKTQFIKLIKDYAKDSLFNGNGE